MDITYTPTETERFVQWFNKNLYGDTIYTVSTPTLRKRIDQWVHLDGLEPNEELDVRLGVQYLRDQAGIK